VPQPKTNPTTLSSEASERARENRKRIQAITDKFRFRPVGVEDGHTLVFACDSLTGDGEYEIRHNVFEDFVSCTCPDHTYRHQKKAPRWDDPNVCKHVHLLRARLQDQ
jgi:hypothetical protein